MTTATVEPGTRTARPLPDVAPSRLAHVVFRTNQMQKMIDWYRAVLKAEVVHADPKIAFLTYDEEHHRIALIAAEQYAPKPAPSTVGFYHIAFSFRNVGELLGTYVRLKRIGILPYRPINHGPTLSFYYNDPDGNNVELQVDAFARLEECKDFMRGPLFEANPIGLAVDPDELLARYDAGVPESELLKRADR